MAKFWMTDEQIASEYRTAKDRISQVEILSQLNCVPIDGVIDKLMSLGAMTEKEAQLAAAGRTKYSRSRRITIEMDDRLMKLYLDGYSDTAIAELVGVGRWCVLQWRKRNALPAKNPSKTADGRWVKHRDIKKK